jgi:hypothetical protein
MPATPNVDQISTLEAEISLRNDELYAQITNLTNALLAKEEETVAIINELELAKEHLLADKNALLVQLSLRNGELDDAFAQITNLTNDLQIKEGQSLEVIKALETSRDATLAEKGNSFALKV